MVDDIRVQWSSKILSEWWWLSFIVSLHKARCMHRRHGMHPKMTVGQVAFRKLVVSKYHKTDDVLLHENLIMDFCDACVGDDRHPLKRKITSRNGWQHVSTVLRFFFTVVNFIICITFFQTVKSGELCLLACDIIEIHIVMFKEEKLQRKRKRNCGRPGG